MVQRITDDHTRALAGAWVTAWSELAPDFEDSLTLLFAGAKDGYVSKAAVNRNTRLAEALELARARLKELADTVEPMVAADLPDVTQQAYVSQAAMTASQLPSGQAAIVATFDRAASEAVDAIVARSLEQIHKDTRPLSDDAIRAMKGELVKGVALGDNPRTTARRIMKRTEGRFNGGLERAMVISRNELLDSGRAAALLSDEANADVLTGWIWSASLGSRTCPSCLANHGTEHSVKEPGPIDHHQGRCARVPKTKSWAELGFDGVTEPADVFPDAKQWFENLTPGSQREIMGAERLQLLQDGKVSWADLTRRTTNGQWRDSMTVTPVKTLRTKAGTVSESRRRSRRRFR